MDIKFLWVIMAVITTILFMFQASVDTVSTEAGVIFNTEGTLMEVYNLNTSGGYTLNQDFNEGVPELPSEVSTDSSSDYTDIFKSIKTWFTGTTLGKSGLIIKNLFYAIPNALIGTGMPDFMSYGLGVMWVLFAMFSFVMFMRGLI